VAHPKVVGLYDQLFASHFENSPVLDLSLRRGQGHL
jgi:hypothetical protein